MTEHNDPGETDGLLQLTVHAIMGINAGSLIVLVLSAHLIGSFLYHLPSLLGDHFSMSTPDWTPPSSIESAAAFGFVLIRLVANVLLDAVLPIVVWAGARLVATAIETRQDSTREAAP